MATRSLGSLTLDLIAKIGGFTRGMDEAERISDRKSREIARKQKARAKEVEKAWSDATKWVSGAFAGISIAGLFTKFISESIAAQNEQAQLAAVLRSTGEAAGFTAGQLNKMSAEMAGKSIFSEGEITSAQTRLLSYTGIVGEQFPEAMQAVIDMSARMGMSLEQSAETIGKALDVPSKGLTALSKQGFRFTEDQKKMAERLEASGRTAEAQGIILDALKSSYGGAAEAARNTFGGALIGLRNELNSLITGDDGSLQGATEAVNDLTNVLQSTEVKQAFATLTSLIAGTITKLVEGATKFLEFGKAVGTFLAIKINGPDDPYEIVAKDIERVREEITSLDNLLNKPRKSGLPLSTVEVQNLQNQLAFAKKNLQDLLSVQKGLDSVVPAGPNTSGTKPRPRRPAPTGLTDDQKREAERAAKAAQAYLENLEKQLRATENLSMAETVLRDIQEGRLKLAGGITKERLVDIAKQIDMEKELEQIAKDFKKLEEEALERKKALKEAGQAVYDATRTPAERLNVELARLNDLLAKGAINWDTYSRAVFAAQDVFESSAEKSKEVLSDWDKFAQQAIENTQNALADTIFKGMQGEFDDVLSGFTQMLNRMVAEAVAADLSRRLFGSKVEGGSGDGWLGAAANWISGFFAPGRANGGGVMAGGLYEINENSPEVLAMGGRQYLMMGNQGGKVLSATGRTINQTVNFYNNGPIDRRTQTQLARSAGIALSQGSRNG